MVNDKSTQFEFYYSAEHPERLDKYLASKLIDLSRSRLQSLIKDGNVTVDNETILKPSFDLRPQSHIQLSIPPTIEASIKPESIPLDVVYEDDNVLVINKQAGMVVHPGAGHLTGTLVQAALAHDPHLEGIGGELRPGIVHRLDKDTSGVIMIAKNDRTHKWLQDQFKSRLTKKVYIALVDGTPPTVQGLVDAPIGRDPTHRQRMAVVSKEKGRLAQTIYRTVEKYKNHTLLEVQPLTGRTHQIRVHLRFLGCPITGDVIYGAKRKTIDMDRFFLHASKLTITLPAQTEPIEFMAQLPKELVTILESLRLNERIV